MSVTVGSGNVFADIGMPHPEEVLAKAELVRAIATVIARKKMPPATVARIVGLPPPELSDLLDGNTLGFSRDQLTEFLYRIA